LADVREHLKGALEAIGLVERAPRPLLRFGSRLPEFSITTSDDGGVVATLHGDEAEKTAYLQREQLADAGLQVFVFIDPERDARLTNISAGPTAKPGVFEMGTAAGSRATQTYAPSSAPPS